ncbi:sensor histidine kinase [Pontibacter silvestris]|uniref:Sensor histidine kinase n=1 Tax=Pontibacter silvestris TaxID=2305183 RepID=A0ABW4X1P8_9BACT|nr:histidine kinase [Pontibacter silvestris]MCC9136093.1 sensor histidine kinase [Pontibacter silvestris]
MNKSSNYNRELFIVALITSVFFGVFSVLPMLISSHLSFIAPPPPPPPHALHGVMREHPPVNLTSSIVVTTALMLCLWMMNIFIYSRLRNIKAKEQTMNIIRYVISYAVMFGLVTAYYLVLTMFVPDPRHGRQLFFPFIAGITNNTIVLIILDLVVLQRKKALVELENTELKMNSIIAQHQHLKHQLQPHFLFNSLNILKSLIKKQPQEAEDYLIRLSEFLRSSITANNQNTIALQEELKLCIDYLEMQKVRFKDAFVYKINIPEDIKKSGYLPVFSLQLLAENAIKHNSLTTEEPLTIWISYTGEDSIIIKNNKKPKRINESSSGIGLRNLSERYKVISGDEINIMNSENFFSVELKVLES